MPTRLFRLLATGLDLLRRRRLILALDVRVLDGQAPNVEVVADGDNDVNDEAAVDANRHAEHAEHEGDLVHAVAERRGPPDAGDGAVLEEDGAERVDDAERERDHEHVPVGEVELDEVGRDHLADAVGVDEAAEEGEGHQVAVQDVGLQREVRHDEAPGDEEGAQADEGVAAAVAAGAAGLDHVARRLERVEDQHDAALDHVPVGEVEVVDKVGEERQLRDAERGEQRLLPEVGAADEAREGVDAHEDEDALDGPVDDAERQRLGVVLVPGLDVKGHEAGEEGRDRLPRLAHVLGAGEDEDLEGRVAGVDTVIEELAEGPGLAGSATVRHTSLWSVTCPHLVPSCGEAAPVKGDVRLGAVNGVECLVEEETDGPAEVDPWWAVLVERRIVPEQGQQVGDDKGEARQGDEVWRHALGEALDDDIVVEGLEDVLGRQRVVDAGIPVLLEVWQLFLPYVDHDGGVCGFVGMIAIAAVESRNDSAWR